jgi:hypothetical protein
MLKERGGDSANVRSVLLIKRTTFAGASCLQAEWLCQRIEDALPFTLTQYSDSD